MCPPAQANVSCRQDQVRHEQPASQRDNDGSAGFKLDARNGYRKRDKGAYGENCKRDREQGLPHLRRRQCQLLTEVQLTVPALSLQESRARPGGPKQVLSASRQKVGQLADKPSVGNRIDACRTLNIATASCAPGERRY